MPLTGLILVRAVCVRKIWASLGFGGTSNMITHFRRIWDNLRINLGEQGMSLLGKGTLRKTFREQWNLLLGTKESEIFEGIREHTTSLPPTSSPCLGGPH